MARAALCPADSRTLAGIRHAVLPATKYFGQMGVISWANTPLPIFMRTFKSLKTQNTLLVIF